MTSCQNTRKRRKIAKYSEHPGQKKKQQTDRTAAEEEMRKLQELKQKEERILFLSDQVDKNKMAGAERRQNF